MIVLPADWRSITGEAIAREVISQVELRAREEFQRLWIRTLLDLISATAAEPNHPPQTFKPVKNLGWRIDSLLYAFFPRVDDESLQRCEQANQRFGIIATVPDGYARIFQNAVEVACRRRPPIVMAVPHFTGWRFMWAMYDFRNDGVVPYFVRRFNLRARQSKHEPIKELTLSLP
jgi:hypothetical protein